MLRPSVPLLAFVLATSGHAQMLVQATGGVANYAGLGTGHQIAGGCTQGSTVSVSLVNLPLAPIFMPLGTRDFYRKHGDVAVNRVTDELWACDGEVCVAYSMVTGLPVRTFSLIGFKATGMGCESGPVGFEKLWFTGYSAGIPAPNQDPPIGSFGIGWLTPPLGGGFSPLTTLPVTFTSIPLDVDFDASSNTLWIGDEAGIVTQVTTAGAPVGSFATYGLNMPCGPLTPQAITGIAVDAAAAMPGVVIVETIGFMRRMMAPGILAPPTNYAPASCMGTTTSVALGSGMAFAARPIPLNVSLSPANQIGQFIVGAPSVTFTNSGGFAAHILCASFTSQCPPVSLPVNTPPLLLYLSGQMATFPMMFPGPGQNAMMTLFYPPAVPVGATLFLQWAMISSSGAIFGGQPSMIVLSRR